MPIDCTCIYFLPQIVQANFANDRCVKCRGVTLKILFGPRYPGPRMFLVEVTSRTSSNHRLRLSVTSWTK